MAPPRLQLTDKRTDHPAIALSSTTGLRAHQQAAVAAVVDHDLAVIVAPPGPDKTVTACAVIAHHRQPTLILVDRKPLLAQWRDRLAEHLGLTDDQIGVIGGGTDRPTGIVDVAMIQSIARREHPDTVFARYGLVVVDECHTCRLCRSRPASAPHPPDAGSAAPPPRSAETALVQRRLSGQYVGGSDAVQPGRRAGRASVG